LEQRPFTRIYVFYNSQGDNTNVYEISSGLGGTQRIRLMNNTNYNVELRVNGIAGQTLGYAPATMTQTDLMVSPGQYMLFPIFKYFNAARNTIGSIFPRGAAGNYYSWVFIANDPNEVVQLQLAQALTAFQANKTLGAAWMLVSNDTLNAIEVSQGIRLITDSMGFSYFNPGDVQVIQVDMMAAGGTAYASSRQVSGYHVGIAGVLAQIRNSADPNFDDLSNNTPNTFTLLTDHQYFVYVTGNHNDGDLQAVININEGTPINFSDFTANRP
jgi:hypothetical protein